MPCRKTDRMCCLWVSWSKLQGTYTSVAAAAAHSLPVCCHGIKSSSTLQSRLPRALLADGCQQQTGHSTPAACQTTQLQ